MLKLIYIITFLYSFLSYGNISFCNKDLESMPVLSGGREKPLFVLAEESLKFISGKNKLNDLSATEVFCKLTLSAFGMPLSLTVPVKVDHVDARKILGLKENQDQVDITDLLGMVGLLNSEIAKLKENNSYKKELNRIIQRIETYQAISQARAWTVPVLKDQKIEFIPMGEYLTMDRMASFRKKSDNPLKLMLEEAKNDYIKIKGDHYLLELKYFKWNFSVIALVLSLISLALFVIIKKSLFGHIFVGLTLGVQIAMMSMRVFISSRAPITNMYETVMFSGFGALVIGQIISLYRKEKAFTIAGLGYNILCLMMMKFAHGMLDEGISPLVPVLRDNFWLSTHVSTVILSYAALALSWILANILMIKGRFFKITTEEEKYQVDLIYTCIKFGVVLLSAGIILGGVWADYSWGRFWGWDPKETWSLIVLLVYMAILHGKYTTWIPAKRFVPLVAGAFMSVMMAWFGVNYILASGLHSYGFSEGGAIFLGSFFLIQITLLVVHGIRKKSSVTEMN